MNIRPEQIEIHEHVNLQTATIEYRASVRFAVIVAVPERELVFACGDAISIAALADRARAQAVEAIITSPEKYLTKLGDAVRLVEFNPNQFKP